MRKRRENQWNDMNRDAEGCLPCRVQGTTYISVNLKCHCIGRGGQKSAELFYHIKMLDSHYRQQEHIYDLISLAQKISHMDHWSPWLGPLRRNTKAYICARYIRSTISFYL